MKPKSLILLSGGLDSVVNFKKALEETEVVAILTFNYEQKALQKEIESTELISEMYNIKHKIISLDWLSEMDEGLTCGNIPKFDALRLDDLDYSKSTARAVWVPNRNGIMINIAAAYADHSGINQIIVGFNREEGLTFPDNTSEFLQRTNAALEYSTLVKPIVKSYTIDMDKTEIVRLGIEIKAPFEFIWSCYYSGREMCGECESCQRLKRALNTNNYFKEFESVNKWKFRKSC